MRRFFIGLGIAILGFVLLACLGGGILLDLFFNLIAGWAFYSERVLPRIRPSGPGVLTAIACLSALFLGGHMFLRWLHAQIAAAKKSSGEPPRSWPARRTGALLGLIVLMFVAGIAAVGVSHQTAWLLTSPEPLIGGGMRQFADRMSSENNLKQVALAMFLYQDKYGALPPSATFDQQGRPLLSWRVLILPYLEREALFERFHLDEPWDSPHNLRLLPRMPKVYHSLAAGDATDSFRTHNQVFAGPGTAFEGPNGLRVPNDFPDGLANTFLIVEAADAVPWTKPEDLAYSPDKPLPALGQLAPAIFLAVMADGSCRTVERKLAEANIRAFITRNGGEKLELYNERK